MKPAGYKSAHRPMRIAVCILSGVVLSVTTACSVFGVESVEEAPYALFQKDEQFEIRDYQSYVVAQTRVNADYKQSGNLAFRKLFKYISGENESSAKISMTAPVIAEPSENTKGEKIAMTAPVLSEKDGQGWLYQFVLPDEYTIENAPTPLNPEIELVEVQPRRVAVVRYSGRATAKARTKHTEALIEWIDSQGLEPVSEPRWAGYDAPWKLPSLRRNEVLIDITNQ